MNNNIQIKLVELSDYDAYYDIRSEEKNLFWTGYDSPPNYTDFKNWFIERIASKSNNLFLAFNQKKECIGSLNIDNHSEFFLIGYSVKEMYEGMGFATEIVRQAILKVQEISKDLPIRAWVNYLNKGSMRVLEKNGFKKSPISEKRIRHGNLEEYILFELKA